MTNRQNCSSLFTILLFLSSCSSDVDPGGQIWWMVVGFPIIGIAYFVGRKSVMIYNLFVEKNKRVSEEDTVISTIVGVILFLLAYL